MKFHEISSLEISKTDFNAPILWGKRDEFHIVRLVRVVILKQANRARNRHPSPKKEYRGVKGGVKIVRRSILTRTEHRARA